MVFNHLNCLARKIIAFLQQFLYESDISGKNHSAKQNQTLD